MAEHGGPDEPGFFPDMDDIRERAGLAFHSLMGDKIPDAEEIRRDLIRIGAQYEQTIQIIREQRVALQSLAESDERVAKLLALVDKGNVEATANKILERASVTQTEAAEMIDDLKTVTAALHDLNRIFEVDVGKVTDNLDRLIADSRIDTETRRGIAVDISKFVEQGLRQREDDLNKQKETPLEQLQALIRQAESLEELKNLLKASPTSADFEKNNAAIVAAIGKLGAEMSGVKMQTTLDNLGKVLDSSVLTNKELTDTLEKHTKSNKTLEEMFKDFSDLISKGKRAGQGLISTVLASMGLGGLDEVFGISEKLTALGGSFVTGMTPALLAAAPIMGTAFGLAAVAALNEWAVHHLAQEKANELGLTLDQYQKAQEDQKIRLADPAGKNLRQSFQDYLELGTAIEGGVPMNPDQDIVELAKKGQRTPIGSLPSPTIPTGPYARGVQIPGITIPHDAEIGPGRPGTFPAPLTPPVPELRSRTPTGMVQPSPMLVPELPSGFHLQTGLVGALEEMVNRSNANRQVAAPRIDMTPDHPGLLRQLQVDDLHLAVSGSALLDR